MIIGKIGDSTIATCDVAPIIGSSDKYLTCSDIYAYYQGQSYSLTKNIYQSGLWASGNSGYCDIYIVYVFTSYPTNFTNNMSGSAKSYDDATNGIYVRLIETGYSINGEVDTPGIIQLGGSPLDFFDSISVPLVIPSLSGGAGSGYIGNSLLSNKKMVGYNVPTSSAESTKTESVNEASENPVSGKPKIGNGFARIKFLRAPSVNVNIDIEAANQLKYNNVSPNFRIGSMGSYDSESQSYFFSQDADMTYGNLSIPKQALISATQLSFECEAKVMSTAYGSFADVEFYFHGIEDGGDLIECIVSNGNNEGSSGPKIALNNGGSRWGGNAPLDMDGYRGAFHKVKYILSMNNGKVLRAELYIDDVLIGDNDFNTDLNFRSNNNYTAFFGATDNSYIKNYKIAIIGGV